VLVANNLDHKQLFDTFSYLKGRVHCFSMQVVMSKCFINPEKIGADQSCRFREKRTFNFKK